jgi:multidrug transporter EmrE-like cation transporter
LDPLVIALVAISGVLHVAWNVRIKTAGDPLLAAAIGLVVGALVIVPLGAGTWWLAGAVALPEQGLALGLLSGVIEAAYFVVLAGAYRRGDLSVVYPIARGTAPLILVVVGVVLLGATAPTWAASSAVPTWSAGSPMRGSTTSGPAPAVVGGTRWPNTTSLCGHGSRTSRGRRHEDPKADEELVSH